MVRNAMRAVVVVGLLGVSWSCSGTYSGADASPIGFV